MGHPKLSALSHPIFRHVVAPFFQGKDARDLDRIIDGVYLKGSHYKMQGQLVWVPVAEAEFAILDFLGRVVKLPEAALLGRFKGKSVPLYLANNHRHLGPEGSLKRIVASVEKIDAKAVKFKIGGGLGFLYMGIYAACCPNPGSFEEDKGLHHDFPWQSAGTPIKVEQDVMIAPDGPGIGIEIDPDYRSKAN